MKTKFLVALILLAGLVVGCGPSASSSNTSSGLDPVPADYAGKTNPLGAEASASGEKVYKDYCMACHGRSGYGDGPSGAALMPAPKNLIALQSQVGDDYLFWRISTGKDGTAMVSWQGVLTDEQIWQVITYLHTLK